jgi:hypothetical protein
MMTDVSRVRTAIIVTNLMMEAARTSETSVNINLTTRRYIPEDFELYFKILPRLLPIKNRKARASNKFESEAATH